MIITKATASRIWNAHHDIENGKKILADMEEQIRRAGNHDKGAEHESNPRDAFGKHRCLTLGIPTDNRSERMLDVQPRLAIAIIKAHIADKEKDLIEASQIAVIEAGTIPVVEMAKPTADQP